MTELEIIKGARVILNKEEHWKKYSVDWEGSCCLLGALAKSANCMPKAYDHSAPSQYQNACDLIEALSGGVCIGDASGRVWRFNDSPETEYKDVVKLLDTAIEILEA